MPPAVEKVVMTSVGGEKKKAKTKTHIKIKPIREIREKRKPPGLFIIHLENKTKKDQRASSERGFK